MQDHEMTQPPQPPQQYGAPQPYQPMQHPPQPAASPSRGSLAMAPRIILGIIVGLFVLPILLGAPIVAESHAELAIMLIGAIAVGALLLAFVVRPTPTTRILAIIGLAIWLAAMLYATIDAFPDSLAGVSTAEIAFGAPRIVMGNMMGPVAASVCVFLISRSMKRAEKQ